ncbi:YdeI family protein [Aestuariivivens sp. NBU2969]|uniref:YdeI/OmpD-associated family protein n=1 Tax=Aestuariivivens sp. NBU2969 TaxID=2873267 RepID=UPI001CC0BE04|nr:YdeI/OmpD-associated family protein [Aestuariivivens sp. NBU2969]
MEEFPELYFECGVDWYSWLKENHNLHKGVYLIFYKLELNIPTMRWEEAVKVALCFGWIDSTVKSLGNGKRRQYFTPRNPKSVWSALNKSYIQELTANNLIHESGFEAIKIAKQNGSWTALDDVENEVIPKDLQTAFRENPIALKNYKNLAPSYRKGYLYWLNQAKRKITRQKRILEIIKYCTNNIKSREDW